MLVVTKGFERITQAMCALACSPQTPHSGHRSSPLRKQDGWLLRCEGFAAPKCGLVTRACLAECRERRQKLLKEFQELDDLGDQQQNLVKSVLVVGNMQQFLSVVAWLTSSRRFMEHLRFKVRQKPKETLSLRIATWMSTCDENVLCFFAKIGVTGTLFFTRNRVECVSQIL